VRPVIRTRPLNISQSADGPPRAFTVALAHRAGLRQPQGLLLLVADDCRPSKHLKPVGPPGPFARGSSGRT
jgi:hypothetical protein